MGGLAILAIAAALFFQAPAVVAAIHPAPAAQWTEVARPYRAFQLTMPELARRPFGYAILRRDADGARKDVLTWGQMAASGPFVEVEIYRAGSQTAGFIDAPSEIAARIVGYTVTDDVKPAGRVDSKFGPVALVDFAISSSGHERRCLGFARPFSEPAMQIAGWYCSAGEEVVDRAMLACFIDHLTILSAGGDTRVDTLFARAEIKRTFCGKRNPILAATPERAAAADPPHRKRARVRLRERIQLR
jgi:hypothetical protein